MDIQEIINELENRFSKPLEEFYNRRIIIWLDHEREFEEYIDDIHIDGVNVIKLEEENSLYVKKTVCYDDKDSDFLIYSLVMYKENDDNWIFDIFEYGEEFRADRTSLIMDELNISDTSDLRISIKKYNKFFNSQERKAKFNSSKRIHKKEDLDFEILKIISKSSAKKLTQILINLYSQSLDMNENQIYKDFVKYSIDDVFWEYIGRACGYYEEERSIYNLLKHLILTAESRNLKHEIFNGLEEYIKANYDTFCHELVSTWLNNSQKDRLYELIRIIEKDINLERRLQDFEADELEDSIAFPIIDEMILSKLFNEFHNGLFDSNRIERVLEKRRVKAWYSKFENYYNGIYYYKLMQEFKASHFNGFPLESAKSIWDSYTKTYYLMDTYYRKFQLAFQASIRNSNDYLDDDFKTLAEYLDDFYKNWFVTKLNQTWNDASEDEFSKYGRVLDIASQTDFYKTNIENDTNRKFVIISDALRYEVALELNDLLQAEMRGKISISTMQGIYPTITKFGMAALLPHNELSLDKKSSGDIKVLVDGKSTESTNRENILKQYNENSLVINADELRSMKRNQRQDLVKGKEVIYIYHNKIDSTSHTHEASVFDACEDTIVEIKEIIRIIVNDFSGTHIIVTSDHGFNYTWKPFEEMDKIEKLTFGKSYIELGRRYVITPKDTETEFLLPVNLLNGTTDYEAYSPRDIKRFKAGSGLNFVHGGLSLQEIVVPLIKYQHLRNDSQEYQKNRDKYDTRPVKLLLLSPYRNISNMMFSLDFYQEESVSNLVEPVSYYLYFIDSRGRKVSDIKKIIADKQSKLEKDRVTRVILNLISGRYSKEDDYYLVIEGKDVDIEAKRYPFVIDIAKPFDGDEFFS